MPKSNKSMTIIMIFSMKKKSTSFKFTALILMVRLRHSIIKVKSKRRKKKEFINFSKKELKSGVSRKGELMKKKKESQINV